MALTIVYIMCGGPCVPKPQCTCRLMIHVCPNHCVRNVWCSLSRFFNVFHVFHVFPVLPVFHVLKVFYVFLVFCPLFFVFIVFQVFHVFNVLQFSLASASAGAVGLTFSPFREHFLSGRPKNLTMEVPFPWLAPPPVLNSCLCECGRGRPKSFILPVPERPRSA